MKPMPCIPVLSLALLCVPAAQAMQHRHARPADATPAPPPGEAHAAHSHHHDAHGTQAATLPREPIPAITQADREAAFPALASHMAHAPERHWKLLLERVELREMDHGRGQAWGAEAWMGGDTRRWWVRSEGEREAGRTAAASVELSHGRSMSPWWEWVAGLRHDVVADASGQTRALVGIQGMAPYRLEVAANAMLGGTSRVTVELEVEYDLLLSNRLILQPVMEVSLHARADEARGIGKGFATSEGGLRLRYELDRRFAPYVGYTWSRAHADTAALRRRAGISDREHGWVAGVRIWF